ncbi:MAG: motility associated factor glycosyltransferase family protein [Rhodospirillales bacterium]|nr:motility associated factor glycosyltransferase family protein [Rhodospirillales bacterium]
MNVSANATTTPGVSEAAQAAVALHKSNMDFFKKYLPDIHKVLSKITPKTELVWLENDDVNVRDGQNLRYTAGARTDAAKQIKVFKRSPARVVFGRPPTEVKPEDAEKQLTEGEFLTQKFDDLATDEHIRRVIIGTARVVKEQNAEIADMVARDHPYYLGVYGVGLGFHIMPLVEHYDPACVIIAECEPEMLFHSTFTFDWNAFYEYMDERKKKIRVIFEDDGRTILTKVSGIIQSECLLGLDGVLSFQHSQAPALKVAFNEFQSPKTANLASFIGYIVDEYNMMKNSFRNLRSGTKRMLGPVRKSVNAPVLVVASGPSLEDNIDFVKRVQDRMIIISSGSSLAVLLKNGIKPDFHTNLERAKSVYQRHVELAEEFDLSNIYVVMTSTIWPGIDSFFKEALYFLRPALSPLAVFCEHDAQILHNEGPQVANTSFALAKRLQAKEIYLLGVDLGTTDPKRPRASQAWQGQRPRYLTIPVRGNLGRTVFTDQALIQQRATLEAQIRKVAEAGGKVFNLGSGVRFEGAPARRLEDVDPPSIGVDKDRHVKDLFEQFPVYTRERFLAAWQSAHVRESIANMIQEMVDALEKSEAWDHKLIRRFEEINAYVGKSLRNQFAPRLFRGSVLRACMHVNAIFLRLKDPAKAPELYQAIRAEFIDFLRELEMEGYALADELESEDEAFAVQYA